MPAWLCEQVEVAIGEATSSDDSCVSVASSPATTALVTATEVSGTRTELTQTASVNCELVQVDNDGDGIVNNDPIGDCDGDGNDDDNGDGIVDNDPVETCGANICVVWSLPDECVDDEDGVDTQIRGAIDSL